MVLSRPGFVVSGGFLAANGAPGEKGPLLTQLAGAATCFVQHSVAEAQKIPGYLWRGVDEEGEEVNLGIPEVVPFIGLPRKPFGREAVVFCPG